jgi:hypothetical protein
MHCLTSPILFLVPFGHYLVLMDVPIDDILVLEKKSASPYAVWCTRTWDKKS